MWHKVLFVFSLLLVQIATARLDCWEHWIAANNAEGESVKIERWVEKDGFHKSLKTKLYFNSVSTFLLLEEFPASFYIDSYELEELKRFEKIPSFIIQSPFDLEKPEFLATTQYFALYGVERYYYSN